MESVDDEPIEVDRNVRRAVVCSRVLTKRASSSPELHLPLDDNSPGHSDFDDVDMVTAVLLAPFPKDTKKSTLRLRERKSISPPLY